MWQLCELLYSSYLLTYLLLDRRTVDKRFRAQTTSICSPFRQNSKLRQRDRHTTIDRRPVTGPRGTRHLVTRFSRHRHYYTYCTVLCHPLCFSPSHIIRLPAHVHGWLGRRVVSVLDSGAEGPGFKSQSRRYRETVLGKLFTPVVPQFTKQHNW